MLKRANNYAFSFILEQTKKVELQKFNLLFILQLQLLVFLE